MSQALDAITSPKIRPALLLAEAAAWLHMLGKYHEDFLKGKLALATALPDDLPDSLKDLLEKPWPGPIWANLNIPELDAAGLSINDLVKNHHSHAETLPGLVRLLSDAHGRGSGIEKGVLHRFAPGQKETVFAATALGHEVAPIDLAVLAVRRGQFYVDLEKQLTAMQGAADAAWPSLRQDFLTLIGAHFPTTLADSRRPFNDVTLFDQTFAAVAFFKAALAQVMLTGWQPPNPGDVKKPQYQWRLLRLGLDGPAFWGQADGVNDLLSRRGALTGLLDAARRLLEQDLPLGLEVYRDQQGSAFLVPNVDGLLEATQQGLPLRQRLQTLAHDWLQGEAFFDLALSEASRSLRRFGQFISAPVSFTPPVPAQIKQWWAGGASQANRQVCQVCGLRPQGPTLKSIERGLCAVCETRRSARAEVWAQDLSTGTIWMSEVADRHGRLALMVGRFDLDPWLSGEAFNAIPGCDPLQRQVSDPERGGKSYAFGAAALVQVCDQALKLPNQSLGGGTLLDNLLLKDYRGGLSQRGELYELFVADTDLDADKRAGWRFALALLRQQPSFARIRRTWETTQTFWQEVSAMLAVGQAGPRLEIRGALFPAGREPTPGRFHAYELALEGGLRLNVVWDEPNRRFITADNLERAAELLGQDKEESALAAVQRRLAGRLTIEEPSGYGAPNRRWGEIEVHSREAIPNSAYRPSVPILAEPGMFMALVPADKALAGITGIFRKYELEMDKVANRLPLRLGLIAAPQHTPLRAILDAGRRMLRGAEFPDQDWQVSENHTAHLTLLRQARRIDWAPPQTCGKDTPDAWFPYAFAASAGQAARHLESAPALGQGPEPLVYAAELPVGTTIRFTPSTFDFAWLDAAANRFEIAYTSQPPDQPGSRRGLPRRPYLWRELQTLEEIWQTLKGGLSVNQVYILRDVIEERRQAWPLEAADLARGGVFWQFCRDALRNAGWRVRPPSDCDAWADYAVRGWLTDAVELHLHILKEKIDQDKVNPQP